MKCLISVKDETFMTALRSCMESSVEEMMPRCCAGCLLTLIRSRCSPPYSLNKDGESVTSAGGLACVCECSPPGPVPSFSVVNFCIEDLCSTLLRKVVNFYQATRRQFPEDSNIHASNRHGKGIFLRGKGLVWLTDSPPSTSRLSRQFGILEVSQSYEPPWLLTGDNINFLPTS